jgi:ABC-type transport system substrate-binding protein
MRIDKKYVGKKISFKLDYDPSSALEKSIVEYLKNIWTTSLISVQLNPLTKAEKLRRMFAKESEAVLGRKSIDYPDGFSVLTYFKGKYDSNYFHVDDPKVENAISMSVREFDSEKRTDLYKKTQLLILRHHTMIPLMFGSQASGFWGPKVKNVPTHPMGSHTMHLETIEMRTL